MNRKDFLIILFLLTSGFVTRFYRLDYAEGKPIFDELKYYREAALSYLQNRDDPNFEHPPLSKELIAFSISRFGDNADGWRLPSLVFSLAGNVVIYLFVRDLFGHRLIGFLTSIFLSFDLLYFVHSRLAVPETVFASLAWLCLYFLWRFARDQKPPHLILGSIFLGLALSTKWTALLVLIPYAFLMIGSRKIKSFLFSLITLLPITLLLYLAAYLPYLGRHSPADLIYLQLQIFWHWVEFSNRLGGELSPGLYLLNHAYAWVLNPGWAYEIQKIGVGNVKLIWAAYHPLLWFGSLFFLFAFLRRHGWRLGPDGRPFCLAAALSFFVPWLLIARVQYPYYFLVGLPFLYAFLAERLAGWQKTRPERFWASIILTTLIFILFYPLIANVAVPEKYLEIILRSKISLAN